MYFLHGYQFSHDSYIALAEPLPRSVYHVGDYITILYLFTSHKERKTHLFYTYIYGIASFLAHSACNHHGSSHRARLSFISRGKDSRRKRRNHLHSLYFLFSFFLLPYCCSLSSPFPSLLLTQSLSLAPIAVPKPSVTALSLSSQLARVQHSGVTYTRLAYQIPLPTGSHH